MQELHALGTASEMMLYEDAFRAMRNAGWSEERTVDIGGELEALRAKGYETWPELETILASYSGLVITFEADGRVDTLRVDARHAAAGVTVAAGRDYETLVGTDLAPIATANFLHSTIYAARDGRFFGAFDAYVWYLGCSFPEMVDAVMRDLGTVIEWPS